MAIQIWDHAGQIVHLEKIYTRIALEVMLCILLRCPKTSEADVDGIAEEVCSRNAKLQHETD